MAVLDWIAVLAHDIASHAYRYLYTTQRRKIANYFAIWLDLSLRNHI